MTRKHRVIVEATFDSLIARKDAVASVYDMLTHSFLSQTDVPSHIKAKDAERVIRSEVQKAERDREDADSSTSVDPGFDFDGYMNRLFDFQDKTFPNGTVDGVIDHLIEEVGEIEENPEDPVEWIDVIMLALGGLHKTGVSRIEIVHQLESKLAVVKDRNWPAPEDQDPAKGVRHIPDNVDMRMVD